MSVSLCADDTMILRGRIFSDLADGDCINIEFPNKISNLKRGKNGNTIIAFNHTGMVVTVTVKVIRGSEDDKTMNAEISSYKNLRSGYTLLYASFTKNIGDGRGNINQDVYTMRDGVITQYPGAKENTEGETEQGVSEYEITFSNSSRSV